MRRVALTFPVTFLMGAGLLACDYERPMPYMPPAPTPDVSEPAAPDVGPPAPDLGSPEPEWTPPATAPAAPGEAEAHGLDPVAPLPPAPPRGRRRMDVTQLDRAFSDVLGGITWTATVNGVEVNQFQALSETLGMPDFLDTTFEDLAATSLFAKFLADASRKACADRIAADLAAPAEAVLLGPLGLGDTPASAADATRMQLQALLLRFHGKALGHSSPELGEWQWLLAASYQHTESMATAWQAVCVALLSHPDFYTY